MLDRQLDERAQAHGGSLARRRCSPSRPAYPVFSASLREMVAAYYFGISGKINAFTVAFQIPNLMRALLADAALSGAFVPVFSELLEKGERRAWRVASTIFWLVLLVHGGAHGAVRAGRPAAHPAVRPGGIDLAVGLSRVLFPIVVLLGLSGIVAGSSTATTSSRFRR